MKNLLNTPGWRSIIAAASVLIAPGVRAAKEDIAFVAEHLPEVAMDNRYAIIPLWMRPVVPGQGAWRFGAGLGYTELGIDSLALRGPMFTLSADRELASWRLTLFAFHDELSFSGALDRRPLDEPFVPAPLAMPVAAEFTNLGGSMLDSGVGLGVRRHFDDSWFGALDLSAGLMWQRVQLNDYRLAYRVLDGPEANAEGSIEFSGTYVHVAPILGFAKSWRSGQWHFSPHAQLAVPLPRRGVKGEITGPGFDLAGNTETNGEGRHFGDPSVTLGLDVTYLPWSLTVDVGSLVSQALVEPFVHQGIDRNWLVQARREW